MSDTDSIVAIKTKAEISDLVAYAKALEQVAAAIEAVSKASAAANVSGAGSVGALPTAGTGGAQHGAPPPVPAPPPAKPPGHPPPAPVSPGGLGYYSAPPVGSPGPGGSSQSPSPGGPAAPPPTPTAPTPAQPAAPARGPDGRFLPRGGRGGSGGGGGWWDPFSFLPGGDRSSSGGGMRAAGGVGMGMVGAAGSFLSNTASTAIGVGLGTSLFGLPMSAINRYMTLSTVITQLDRKFRDAGASAMSFGQSLGYGIARSAQLAEGLGKQTNTIDQGSARQMLGFARFTGADPSTVLGAMGGFSSRSGRPTGAIDLAGVLAAAKTAGMDQGRLDEFLQRLETTSREQFAATGSSSVRSALNVQGLQSVVYGANDPRRANDQSMLGGLNSVMTGSGPMRTYMMRAMGYGSKNGPDYISMRERLDAGINDPRNVLDLFSSFQDRGMGRGAQFRALESVAGGQLKANQIRALVDSLGTKGGLDQYRELVSKGGNAGDMLKGVLSPDELKVFGSSGFAGLGKKGISAGESYENRVESIMMKVGGELAKSIPDLQGTIENLGRLLRDIVGADVGDKLAKATHALEVLTDMIERRSSGPLATLHDDPSGQHAFDVIMQGGLGIQPAYAPVHHGLDPNRPMRYSGDSTHAADGPPEGVHHVRGGGGPR